LLRDQPVTQLHASRYRNPEQLPPGAVLVVGAGASGAQIAEELLRAGRRVFLSVGRHGRLPRRYRGHDMTWWFGALGLFQSTLEQRGPIRVNPSISGAYGGHTIDFRRFAADGIVLVGRMAAARDGVIELAADLARNLAIGDAYYATFLDRADEHAAQRGLNLPDDPAARAVLPVPPCVTEPRRRLDLGADGIAAVIWATGYDVDFGWIDLPVLNARGEPVQRGGVTGVSGLYFLGLSWMTNLNSAFLSGVGDDAAVLADHIAAKSRSEKS
jgi:putative flavoprotein involved in K+ transport